MFRIGEFAALAGLSPRTLRAWDEIGLFRPIWVDPSSGYRYYSPTQLPDLRRIMALRDLGVPLKQIKEQSADLAALLIARRARIEQEQAEVERQLRTLDIRIAADDDLDVVVRPVGGERVATTRERIPAGTSLGPLFYALEAAVRDAGAREDGPPGAIVHADDGADRDVEVFVPVAGPVDPGVATTTTLPRTMAATALHVGPYEPMRGLHGRLAEWASSVGYRASGPARILYLRFGAEPELRLPAAFLTADSADYVTEVQLPISDGG